MKKPTSSFDALGLSTDILTAISRMGFETPTAVQAQVIPRLLENRGDMVALAQTGTGKTAAFGLPILNMINHDNRAPQALVLCPTRELCVQIARDMTAFSACSPAISIVAVYGGTPIQTQLRALDRGVQVIVATPGRMLDILRRKKANLRGVERVILDEADEMLNMGFQEDLEAILSEVPDTAHTLLFSATMPRQVAAIAKNYMKKPEEITVGQRNAGAENVSHECYVVHQRDRYRALKRIADCYPDMYAIVFCRTRQDTQNVADWLIQDGYNVDALHGDLTQVQRDRVMGKFRSKSLQILVATDVAARGLDVNDLTHVVNYNIPDELGNYTHRSGRTGRAGKSGKSVLIINMREKGKVRRIEKMINKTFAYRDVPSGKEVCKAQLLSLIERMKNVEVDHALLDPFIPDIDASLAGMDADVLVKRFISLECNNLLNYYRGEEDLNPRMESSRHKETAPRSRDRNKPSRTERGKRNERRPASSGVRMFINLGKMDGFNPKKLAGLIGRESGHEIALERVDIMKKFSFFDVPAKDLEMVSLAMGMANYKGRDVRVEPVDDDKKGRRFKRTERRVAERQDGVRKPKKHRKGDTGNNKIKRKPSRTKGSSTATKRTQKRTYHS
ncbi:MAG: DEAD/DEAH box helicase [Kiritimatiellae bacterium]|nr:DEAD/DEAH box helicase [Kiritimatiellia bacterium]